jgi:hypothetical protein
MLEHAMHESSFIFNGREIVDILKELRWSPKPGSDDLQVARDEMQWN